MNDHDDNVQMVKDCEQRERRRAYQAEWARQARAKNPAKAVEAARRWQQKNPEKVRAYRAANDDVVKATAAKHRAANPDKEAARRRSWKERNRTSVAEYEKRREFLKASRVPAWADSRAIAAIYVECARVTRETGVEHHVDHEIPLNGKNVCGLHVETNLRVVPATVNLRKYNKMVNE